MRPSLFLGYCIFAICCGLILTGCASTPEARLAQARKVIARTPFEQQPAVYETLEKQGKLTAQQRHNCQSQWNDEKKRRDKAEAEREKAFEKFWASLTPAQQADFMLRVNEQRQQASPNNFGRIMARNAAIANQNNPYGNWQNYQSGGYFNNPVPPNSLSYPTPPPIFGSADALQVYDYFSAEGRARRQRGW